ncbi:HAMP domain-containing histidine kinase [Pseudarthrobacter sp. HLT3-5]|uniref:sensor histidine kinase n=1 Tax=Pseudarthrobacter cellobiosi TaxID=2953654 RepID=UPI00208E8059|nr:HAMP domain-containing sensor histidine kinase [Pseudarthrobacter sp. HLT3-5]MCO4274718.1 HAMP domain-containing histidine kinase [Pseudarthrobacter sp. HLT3-5]
MKLRVLGILSVLAVLIVIIASNAILTSAGRELTQELQINRAASLNRLAQVAFDAASAGETAQLQTEMDRYSELYGEGILIRLQQGTLRSGGLSDDRADVRDAVGRASLNLNDTTLTPLQPFGPSSEVISRSFGSASQVLGEAVLEVNLDAARQKLRERWLIVALAAAALAAVLLLGAARVTEWVLRPVHRLNAAVTELEATGRTGQLPEAGPPELRELSRSFTTMAHTVSHSLDSQRQLIADTSHELRNPVGALRLRIDLLQLELKTAREHNAAAGVLAELERVEEILDGVLRLAAAEHRASEDSARGPLGTPSRGAQAPVDPYPVLQEETERAGPAAQRSGASILLQDPLAPAVHIACNSAELAQMVGELLNNSIKYAPGAHISVAARARQGTVSIEVSDDGPGLSADERTAATSRFWRSPAHRTIRGTGLGMTIVDKLAAANGGRLVLAEASPHGLIARLEFPRAGDVPGPFAGPEQAGPEQAAPRG